MSEDLKTIKELADEIGVSKQAVWQKIKKESSIDLRQFTSKKGNTVYVDVDGQKVIKSAFLFFSSFSQSFRASFGRKKHPKKSGVTCKIKKVPRKRHLYYNIYFWLFHNYF